MDRKIPRAQRARTVVVADSQRILWVVGCCVSDDAKVTADTARVVHFIVRSDERRSAR